MGSVSILVEVSLDVFGYSFVRVIYAEVTFTENIGLQSKDVLHGFLPAGNVGSELGEEGAMDVLTEENPFPRPIHVDGD